MTCTRSSFGTWIATESRACPQTLAGMTPPRPSRVTFLPTTSRGVTFSSTLVCSAIVLRLGPRSRLSERAATVNEHRPVLTEERRLCSIGRAATTYLRRLPRASVHQDRERQSGDDGPARAGARRGRDRDQDVHGHRLWHGHALPGGVRQRDDQWHLPGRAEG